MQRLKMILRVHRPYSIIDIDVAPANRIVKRTDFLVDDDMIATTYSLSSVSVSVPVGFGGTLGAYAIGPILAFSGTCLFISTCPYDI